MGWNPKWKGVNYFFVPWPKLNVFLLNRKNNFLHVSFVSPTSDFKMFLVIKYFNFLPTKNMPFLIEIVCWICGQICLAWGIFLRNKNCCRKFAVLASISAVLSAPLDTRRLFPLYFVFFRKKMEVIRVTLKYNNYNFKQWAKWCSVFECSYSHVYCWSGWVLAWASGPSICKIRPSFNQIISSLLRFSNLCYHMMNLQYFRH